MVLVLQNEGLDENNEHNIHMTKFDDIVKDLLEVKESLEEPNIKMVSENGIDFNPTKTAHDNASLKDRKRKNSTGMLYDLKNQSIRDHSIPKLQQKAFVNSEIQEELVNLIKLLLKWSQWN